MATVWDVYKVLDNGAWVVVASGFTSKEAADADAEKRHKADNRKYFTKERQVGRLFG